MLPADRAPARTVVAFADGADGTCLWFPWRRSGRIAAVMGLADCSPVGAQSPFHPAPQGVGCKSTPLVLCPRNFLESNSLA